MGGTVIETESDKIKVIIEMGQEFGLDDSAILEKMPDGRYFKKEI